jgi:hypothetical protein
MYDGLTEKLKMAEGQRVAVIDAPEGYLADLELPDGVELATQLNNNKFDFVQLFVKNQGDVQHRGPDAYHALKDDGLFWVSYPKRTSGVETDLTRDRGWDGLKELGLEPVAQIAVDDTWSALRFRPSERVKHGR